MARPPKVGLDYFPCYVNLSDEITMIIAKHGLIALSIIQLINMKIYARGYFIEWEERDQLLFKSSVDIEIAIIKEIIDECIKWGLFSSTLFNKYHILTSKLIQENYILATKRRNEVRFIQEFLLISNLKNEYPKEVNVIIYSIIDNNNPVNDDNSTQIITNQMEANLVVVSDRDKNMVSYPEKKSEQQSFEVENPNILNNSFSTQIDNQQIDFWCRNYDFSPDIINEAIKEAKLMGNYNVSYVNGILRNWASQGIRSLNAVYEQRKIRQDFKNLKNRRKSKTKVVELGGASKNRRNTDAEYPSIEGIVQWADTK